jgi:hypothetical protein
MIVSKYQSRDGGPEREAALTWLHRQMAWEQVLNRLRREAGVSPGSVGRGGTIVPERPAA